MKTFEMSFPITPEAFIAYQESGIKRKLTQNGRDVLQGWVPVINICYTLGAEGDAEAMGEYLDRIEGCLAMSAEEPFATRFLRSMRWWVRYAYKEGEQGRKTEKEARK